MRNLRLTSILFALVALTAGGPAHSQFENVGTIDFPTSATGDAQRHFLRGVAILHSFGWKQAIEQFHAAQAIDPDFALAYWGETLSYNHPLQPEVNAESPREALARLGATPEERLAKATTAKERGVARGGRDALGRGWLAGPPGRVHGRHGPPVRAIPDGRRNRHLLRAFRAERRARSATTA